MNRINIGLDCWKIKDVYVFLSVAKKMDWQLFNLEFHEQHVICETSFFNRYAIKKHFPDALLLYSTGLLKQFLYLYHKPYRILSVFIGIGMWIILSQGVYEIKLTGENDKVKDKLLKVLEKEKKVPPFYHDDYLSLKKYLKKEMENEIAWLEIVKRGSKYEIYFTSKEYVLPHVLLREELIAQKDGVIANFELLHGEKTVQINDYVKKGDVLVKNYLVDSKNKEKDLFVEGRVYAYTWETLEIEMKRNKLPIPLQYYQMLFVLRNQVSEQFLEKDEIVKENILHFSHDLDKIRLRVHYTLKQDITSPR